MMLGQMSSRHQDRSVGESIVCAIVSCWADLGILAFHQGIEAFGHCPWKTLSELSILFFFLGKFGLRGGCSPVRRNGMRVPLLSRCGRLGFMTLSLTPASESGRMGSCASDFVWSRSLLSLIESRSGSVIAGRALVSLWRSSSVRARCVTGP